MSAFAYESLPGRVVFGAGRAWPRSAAEVAALGGSGCSSSPTARPRSWPTTSPSSWATARPARWDEVVQHVPVELAERARAAVDRRPAPTPSSAWAAAPSTGLAKAIALTHGLPIVAVPTTYAGSEQTPIYGLTGDRHKQTGPATVARAAARPWCTTRSSPSACRRSVTGPSAFNALAHSVEALWVPGGQPGDVGAGAGGRPGHPPLAADGDARPGRPRRPGRPAVRRLPVRHGARRSTSAGAAPQDLPRARRHASASSTPTPTPSCCPTPSPSTRRRCPARWPAWPRPSARPGGDPAGALWDLAVGERRADLPGRARAAPRTTCPRPPSGPPTEITTNPVPVDASDLLGLLERAYAGDPPGLRRPDTTRGHHPSTNQSTADEGEHVAWTPRPGRRTAP